MRKEQQLVNAQIAVNRAVHLMNTRTGYYAGTRKQILVHIDEAIEHLKDARKRYKRSKK